MMFRFFLFLFFLLPLVSLAAEEEIEKDLLNMQKDMQGILNNLNEKIGNGAAAGAQSAGRIDVARRKALALASDEKFTKAANQLWAHPDRNKLLVVQGIFFVVIYLLRAWRQARAGNWFTRILVGLLFTIILWGGLSYVIPAIILGEPYRIFVHTIWHTLTSP